MNGQQRLPSEDLCRAVVRMTTLGYPPHIIQGCAGVSEPIVVEIMRRYCATGQFVQPAPVVYPVQQIGFYAYPTIPMPMPYFVPPVIYGPPMGYGLPQIQGPPLQVPAVHREPTPEPEPEPEARPVECATELCDYDIEFLRHYTTEYPGATLKKLCELLLELKTAVSEFKLFRALVQNGINNQNNEDRPKLEKQAREDFSYRVGAFEVEQLVFVGQVACDIRYGWSVRGRARRARNQKFTICFGLSNSGTVTLQLFEEPANAKTYREFVDFTTEYIQLLPRENSVLVVDSRLLRTDDPVVEKARSSGTPCLFLPRNSPDYNPIKQAVSSIKAEISQAHESLGEAENKVSVEAIIFYLVYDIAKECAEDWFRECGYT